MTERRELIKEWEKPRPDLEDERGSNATEIRPGDFIILPDADPNWWRYVVGYGPDGRLITVDCRNEIERYSDPTERWLLIESRPVVSWWTEPRGFTTEGRS